MQTPVALENSIIVRLLVLIAEAQNPQDSVGTCDIVNMTENCCFLAGLPRRI